MDHIIAFFNNGGGIDYVLILISKRKYGVQMHRGPFLGNVHGQYMLRSRLQKLSCDTHQASEGGSFTHPDQNDSRGRNQNIPPFQRLISAYRDDILLHFSKEGMMFDNSPHQQKFPGSRLFRSSGENNMIYGNINQFQ